MDWQRLAAFDRLTGKLVRSREVGEAPAHVMTRVDTDQVHTTLSEDAVVEMDPGANSITRRIPVQAAGERAASPTLTGWGRRSHDVDAQLQHR